MKEHGSRYSALRTRLALVVVGLALGFAARWVGDLIHTQVDEPHFKPLPDEVTTADSNSDRTARPDETEDVDSEDKESASGQ